MSNIDAIKNVLLVDDDTNITFLTKVALEGLTDWKVESAVSGAEAIEKAGRTRPDLILLDVMMPGMDGRMTYARLRENRALCATHIIFLTAKAESTEIDDFRKLGADGVIIKPFDPITLVEEIDLLISQAQSRREANVKT
jgi:DNA-binding response OmpR family regulator